MALLAAINRILIMPNDFWWHVRVGAIIVAERAIPRQDVFTFTRYGAAWIYQSWLAEVALYLLYAAGGAALVIFGHAVTITAGYTLPLRDLIRRVGARAAALAGLWAAALSLWNWNIRPQTFTFLLFGILVLLVERHRLARGGGLWWVVPLFVIWANTHGGFVFGLAYLWTYIGAVVAREWWATRRVRGSRGLLLVGVAATLAIGITPWGPLAMVRYVLGFLESKVTVQLNPEFKPLTLRQPDGMLLFGSLLFLVLVVAITSYRPSLEQVVPLVAFALAALWAHRAISWYGMVVMPVLAEAIHAVWPSRAPSRPSVASGILLGGLVLAVGISLPWWRGQLPARVAPTEFFAPTTPVAATRYLCQTVEQDARVFQHQVFASYQIWACPRLRVFVDTRLELYPQEIWDDYLAVEQARFDWDAILRRYEIDYLFLSTFYQPHLIRAARASASWEEIYADDVAVIFQFRPSP